MPRRADRKWARELARKLTAEVNRIRSHDQDRWFQYFASQALELWEVRFLRIEVQCHDDTEHRIFCDSRWTSMERHEGQGKERRSSK